MVITYINVNYSVISPQLVFTLTNNPTLVFTVVKISTTEGPLDMSKIDENAKVGVLFQNTEVSACFGK